MTSKIGTIALAVLLGGCAAATETKPPNETATTPGWKISFFDDFDTFDDANWQDQLLWVNDEDQCYVRNGAYGTREVSDGTLKLRVIDLGESRPCPDNENKFGDVIPDTQYVAGRITSKNRKEFVKGKWTARLRVQNSGQDGMFPAWWLLGAYNNEPPVQEADETVCWPMVGSGEIDIFEHHSDGGANHFAARAIESLGYCGGGDWQSMMAVQAAPLNEFNTYSVEWQDSDLVFRLNEIEFYRGKGLGDQFPEPLFAVLNFAKINPAPMSQTWEMEVDWVKHEHWYDAPGGD